MQDASQCHFLIVPNEPGDSFRVRRRQASLLHWLPERQSARLLLSAIVALCLGSRDSRDVRGFEKGHQTVGVRTKV